MDDIDEINGDNIILNENILINQINYLENYLTSYIFCNSNINLEDLNWKSKLMTIVQSITQFSHCNIKINQNMKGFYCKQCCVFFY